MDALEAFHPDRLASRILGMGDVLSLVEEVERKVDRQKAEKLAKKLVKGKEFDLEDFREQMEQMQNMGGMAGMLDKLPGMDRVPQKALDQVGDRQVIQTIAIINAMTPHERRFPAVLRGSRKKRIAAGSGTRVGCQSFAEAVHADAEDDEADEEKRWHAGHDAADEGRWRDARAAILIHEIFYTKQCCGPRLPEKPDPLTGDTRPLH